MPPFSIAMFVFFGGVVGCFFLVWVVPVEQLYLCKSKWIISPREEENIASRWKKYLRRPNWQTQIFPSIIPKKTIPHKNIFLQRGHCITNPNNINHCIILQDFHQNYLLTSVSRWWFQPIWKILLIGSFPQVGMNMKNIWNHQLGIVWFPPHMGNGPCISEKHQPPHQDLCSKQFLLALSQVGFVPSTITWPRPTTGVKWGPS